MLFTLFFMALNFAISWWNAYAVGRTWAESKHMGGWTHFTSWMGAVMSASGFTWVYVTIVAMLAGNYGYLPEPYVKGTMEIGYIIVLFPILGSGLALWVDSLVAAWRERTFASIAVAGWNSYAQISNIYSATRELPGLFQDVKDLFRKHDSDELGGGLIALAIILVAASVTGGILTTFAILRSAAKKHAEIIRKDYQGKAF